MQCWSPEDFVEEFKEDPEAKTPRKALTDEEVSALKAKYIKEEKKRMRLQRKKQGLVEEVYEEIKKLKCTSEHLLQQDKNGDLTKILHVVDSAECSSAPKLNHTAQSTDANPNKAVSDV